MRISMLFMVLLVLSTIIIAGCGERATSPEGPGPGSEPAVDVDSAVNDVDTGMLPEDSEVEIGEMV